MPPSTASASSSPTSTSTAAAADRRPRAGVGRGEEPITSLADATNHGAGGTEAMTYAAWPPSSPGTCVGCGWTPTTRCRARSRSRTPAILVRSRWSSGRRRWTPRCPPPTTPSRWWRPSRRATATHRSPPGRPGRDHRVAGRHRGGAPRELDRLLRAGAKVSGVWIQDWSGKRTTSFGDRLWWTWQLDRERYPGWARLVRDLAREGIRTTTYVSPFPRRRRSERDPSIPQPVGGRATRAASSRAPTGRRTSWTRGVRRLPSSTSPTRGAVLVRRRDRRRGPRRRRAGFMADFGEGCPSTPCWPTARPPRSTTAGRPVARTVRLACRRADQPRCVTWFRSGDWARRGTPRCSGTVTSW